MWNSDLTITGRYLSPIRNLYDRIIDSFYENGPLTSARLDDLVKNGMISRGIYFNPEQSALRTPKVDLLSRQIEVHESYMSFLWCIIYNFIFLNETSQKLTVENQKVIRINNESAVGLDEMNYLLGWGLSLRDEYSQWPPNLPNPATAGEKTTMANVLLVEVIKYLLYHEIAHLANNHIAYLNLIETPTGMLSQQELYELKELEIEADNYAFDMLVGPELNEHTYNKALACIVAQLSNLFVISKTQHLKQPRHPDIDTRLFNLMNRIMFEEVRYQMNIDQTLNMGLSLFLHIHKIPYIPTDPDNISWHETFEEVLRYLYEKIDEEKNNSGQF
jgi:hypothetical protein